MSILTSRERVKLTINRQVPDRVPIYDSPWDATIRRWHKQGLPEGQSPSEYFDYDFMVFFGELSPRLPVKVLDRNDEYITETTPFGGIRRNHVDYSTTPEIIDCPIKKKDDWPRFKELLKPDFKRLDWCSILQKYSQGRENGKYLVFGAGCGYDLMQYFIKSEQLLMFMAEDPAWIKEIVDVNSDLIIDTLDMLYREGARFDALWVYNDMGYRNCSLFSPVMYEEIIGPSDRKRNQWCHEHGMQTILHSCGCVKGLIPNLVASGFNCLQPLEVKAGMDLNELKPKYGHDIALFGGIDVMLMEEDDDSLIAEEIKSKFDVAKKGGGYLFHSDHSIPISVDFRKYSFVMDCVKKHGSY